MEMSNAICSTATFRIGHNSTFTVYIIKSNQITLPPPPPPCTMVKIRWTMDGRKRDGLIIQMKF